MRASRLLSLLLLLQNRGRMTAARLAEELEVSERTVYRDVESLSAAGVPIYADRGTGGGYSLMEGYRTRLTGLTGGQAESLFLAGVPEAAAELGLGAEMAVANLKLLAALPTEMRERAERVRARFHLDAPAWWRDPDPVPHLSALAGAVWAEHTVEVVYRRYDGRGVRRTLDPLGLVLKAGTWYFLARAHSDRPGAAQVRTYRVARIEDLTDTGAAFDRPGGFDLAEQWALWSRDFEESRHPLRVRVRLTPYGLDMVRSLSSAITAAGTRGAEPGADGDYEVELRVESVDIAASEFIRYGPEIEVLDPPELRARIAELARATLALYRGEDGGGA
ncbi:putative DNA-binding transcriptional regulator YafY [Nocardiopsis mwathae]|uniref:Putative DNA-binding transcriptional regulator YafY n=1 Tax=Nocardiopsis mwathae TaxID=1472723 RepID=A0A7W9YG75_9ACTN|nr:YafY family protein [Nocardiopsis mwathae]MBB6171563.1 putative DNA-binding transcriptional regulator YafY [Nocardiopsis mwathae]